MIYFALISQGVNQSMGQEVIDIETSKPTKEVTEKAATCIVVENSDSGKNSLSV